MPRRRGGEGPEGAASAPTPAKPRARKKKEAAGSATPANDPTSMKMEVMGGPPNYNPMGHPLNHMMFDGMGHPSQMGHPHQQQTPMMLPTSSTSIPQMHCNGPPHPGMMAHHSQALPPGVSDDPSSMMGGPPGTMFVGGHPGMAAGGGTTPAGMPPDYFFSPAQCGQHTPNPTVMYGGAGGPHPGSQHPPQPQSHPPSQQQQQFAEPDPPPFMYQSPPVAQPQNPLMPPPPTAQQPLPPPPSHLAPQPPHGLPPGHPGVPPMPPPPMMLRGIHLTQLGPNFPQPPFLEFRLQEMNRRLFTFSGTQAQFSPEDMCQWWEAFSHEFFDDHAKMQLEVFDETIMCNRKYTLGRQLLPRFYKTIFENGTRELYYVVRERVQERVNHQQPWGLCAIDCDNILMVTKFDKPIQTEVHTDCRLWIEFAPFEDSVGYRIRHWSMLLRGSQEFYQFPKDHSQLSADTQELLRGGGITRYGLPQQVHHFMKLCQVLEPMQIIMHQAKIANIHPRESMNFICFNRHRQMAEQQLQQAAAQQQQMNQAAMMSQQQQQQQQAQGSLPATPSAVGPIGGAGSVKEESGGGGKAKQPRKRQRKTTAGSSSGGTGAPNATGTPPKKRGAGAAAAAAAAMQNTAVVDTPPNIPQPNFPPSQAMFNSSQPPMYTHMPDVLTVGEPSMMGSELGEEDERSISRVENIHYDSASAGGGNNGNGTTHMLMNSMPGSMGQQQKFG